MFSFEANEAVILESQKALEAALSTSPKAQTVLRRIIRKYVMEARAQVEKTLSSRTAIRGRQRVPFAQLYIKRCWVLTSTSTTAERHTAQTVTFHSAKEQAIQRDGAETSARHFFKPLGDRALGQMRDNLAVAIEEEMTKILTKQKD